MPPRRQDVRADALPVHHDERGQHADRQGDHRHEGRAQVEQEEGADQRHDDELLDELVAQVVHRPVDEQRTVVGRNDLDAGRQARLERLELRLHRLDGRARVLARAHHHHAAGDFALAVQLGDAAAHLRADLHERHVAQQDRRGAGQRERDGAEVVERLQEAARADHVLGLGHLDDRAARGLVGLLQRLHRPCLRDAERTHPVRVEHHLVLPHHAADAGHLRHVRDRLQLELQEPVVERAQLADVVPAACGRPARTRRPSRRRSRPGPSEALAPGGQPALHLVEVLDDARARPVRVGLVVEQDVDERVAEERVAADRLRAGHAEHRRGERIGDEVLDDLRRLAGVGRADDDLRVREVGQRIQRRARHREEAGDDQERGRDEDQEPVADGPADEGGDHLAPPRRCTETSS